MRKFNAGILAARGLLVLLPYFAAGTPDVSGALLSCPACPSNCPCGGGGGGGCVASSGDNFHVMQIPFSYATQAGINPCSDSMYNAVISVLPYSKGDVNECSIPATINHAVGVCAPCNPCRACPPPTACVPTACTAAAPACGTTTYGTNGCGTPCAKTGSACPSPPVTPQCPLGFTYFPYYPGGTGSDGHCHVPTGCCVGVFLHPM